METPPRRLGFTLVELLTVIGIVSIMAAILFPVFARAQEQARQTVCLSGERQLGLGFLQYVQDSDETFPNGIRVAGGRLFWPGEGWAGQCLPYFRSPALLRCPDDVTAEAGPNAQPVSYGYNINLAGPFTQPPTAGVGDAALTAPARTVLLFEVSGVTVNLADGREGAAPGGALGPDLSAASDGLDNRLYASNTAPHETSLSDTYATGDLGGRPPPDPARTQFSPAIGRHGGGSNWLLADGHALWLPGGAVSSGVDAPAPDCAQDDAPPRPGCDLPAGTLTAAGAEAHPIGGRATFSVR